MTNGAFTAALAQLRQAKAACEKNDQISAIIQARDIVISRFQPMLRPESISDLSEEAIRPFFYFEHNKHWSGLNRQVNRVCSDMDVFRNTLKVLVDETAPIEDRLNMIVGTIKGLGKGILTAFLHVAYPEKYGVWNNTSHAGLLAVGLMPQFPRGASFSTRYKMINEVLVHLADVLKIDLWTLDALWWMASLGAEEAGEEQEIDLQEKDNATQFALERHLHDFLVDNWSSTDLGKEWEIYSQDGEPEAGDEFVCDVGRIDILARHKTEKDRWLVVELKRGRLSDKVVGQILRYMGWVQDRMCLGGRGTVNGLIISSEMDEKMYYAVKAVPNLSFMSYQIDFRLVQPKSPGNR